MKNELTARRLQSALSNINMTQQELSEKSGVGKSSISHYINGTHTPSKESAAKIGSVLNVDPLWLMGFDVPEKPDTKLLPSDNDPMKDAFMALDRVALKLKTVKEDYQSSDCIRIAKYMSMLNEKGKKEAIKRIEALTNNPEFQKYDENL